MELKTKIAAEDGKQVVVITREFELPLELLFKAYAEPELIEQWMSTTVLELDCRQHGSWRFETRDRNGNVALRTHGVFHEYAPNERITRTFEMENTPFPPQLEFLEFHALSEEASKLTMHIVYKSVEHRDAMLRLPFAQGLNAAHNRLQEAVNNLKTSHHVQQEN
jgi:uncharacterized protein YndB with AHSA1/START domain